jgi:hypothetical protein
MYSNTLLQGLWRNLVDDTGCSSEALILLYAPLGYEDVNSYVE